LSGETTSSVLCQVDFYLLGENSPQANHFACRLALMAWERKQKVYLLTETDVSSGQLDKLMWQYPEGRFLPHALANDQDSSKAPVHVGTHSNLKPTDVVINLCPEAVPQPERFSRILEIVPSADSERQASRVKFISYRNLGLIPQTHEIKK
jgi:DNA polymerase-3 subunit chi